MTMPTGIDAAFAIPDSGAGPATVYMTRGGWVVEHEAAATAPPVRGTSLGELWPQLPAAFRLGIDAACGTGTARVYLFKGGNCVLYDVRANEPVGGASPVPIVNKFPGLRDRPEFTQGIDAGLPAPDGTVYLFRGRNCLNYDLEFNEILDEGTIADYWQNSAFPDPAINDGVTAAFSFPATSNGSLIPLGGREFVDCDVDRHRVTSGSRLLRDRWPYRALVAAANETDGTLWVLGADNGQLVRQIGLGSYLGGAAISPDGFQALVPSFENSPGELYIVDITSGAIRAVEVGRTPYGVTGSPDGLSAYIANLSGNSVSLVDLTTDATRTAAVGSDPSDVAVSPDGSIAYVPCKGSGTIAVVDTATGTKTRDFDGDIGPEAIAITPDGRYLGVISRDGTNGYLLSVNSATGSSRSLRIGQDARAVAASPDSQLLFATDTGPAIRIANAATATAVRDIQLDGKLTWLALSPDGEHLHVTTLRSPGPVPVVLRVDVASGEVLEEYELESSPSSDIHLGAGLAWG
ncbi:hypothetical protein [Allokutzneria albata]|uniref:40-residue YVTN family beta-propeller repeat-containing protein n=1 Tax=Allokutzneria albata TaxID=211114 RepID=A0A1G9S7G2_ALLAB|nr:hypothetical protein [Allokutzneria albata]SDM31399.1 40-residue YVTN family beta-propeller repeat-containing protein [Allokutzneria albata]